MAQQYPLEIPKKMCSKCGEHPRGGASSWCTPCKSENRRRNVAKRPEQYREARRKQYAANREVRQAAQRRYNKTVDWSKRERPPEKNRAKGMVYEALVTGRLVKPASCSACGKRPLSRNLHAHHTDYSKPLDVTWLCSICHGVEHRVGGNANGATV